MTNNKSKSIRMMRNSRKSRKNTQTRSKRCKSRTANSKKRGGGIWDSIKGALTPIQESISQPNQITSEPINNTDVSEIQNNNGGSYKRHRKVRVRN